MARIKHNVIFEKVRQVAAVSVERSTTTLSCRVHQNAAPGAEAAIYDCFVRLVVDLLSISCTTSCKTNAQQTGAMEFEHTSSSLNPVRTNILNKAIVNGILCPGAAF